jgi:hypothetical protein
LHRFIKNRGKSRLDDPIATCLVDKVLHSARPGNINFTT